MRSREFQHTQKSLYSKACLVITFLFIYCSNDTILFGTNANQKTLILGYAVYITVLFALLFFILSKQYPIPRRVLAACILMVCLSSLSACFNQDFNSKYLYEFMLFANSCLFVTCFHCEDLKASFVSCVVFLSGCSLIIYILNTFFPTVVSIFPTVTINNGERFWNLFLGIVPQNQYTAHRSLGIFREPGVFQIFIIAALMLLLFNEEKKKKHFFSAAILTLSLLITFSTAGYIAGIVFLFVYLFRVSRSSVTHMLFLCSMLVLIIFVAVIYLGIIPFDAVMSKFGNSNHPSWIARTGSVVGNVWIGITHPLIGAGWDNTQLLYNELMSEWAHSTVFHNTNTFLKEFSMHGLVFFGIWITGIWRFIETMTDSPAEKIGLLLVLLLTLSDEDLTLNFFPILFVFYGLNAKKEPEPRSDFVSSSTYILGAEKRK